MPVEFDERDSQIVTERMRALDRIPGPRVGDWVEFRDGTVRRVSYVWDWGDGDEVSVQTAETSFGYYLSDCGVSFSGTLYRSVPASKLSDTGERRPANVWIFHHDWHEAHNGVHTSATFRVYHTDVEAPQ